MSGLMRAVTALVLPIPLVFVAAARASGLASLDTLALAVASLYAAIWLWLRPSAFVVTPDALELRWPLRRRRIPRSDIERVHEVGAGALREEFGLLLRVGAGGLWGAFGLAWSSRGRHLGLWVSRHADGFVLVRCRTGRSQLLTPERPAEFVAALAR
jgi:hypothetical protein